MEIAPIPNLIPVRISAPSANPPETTTTRAIDFRRQQSEDDSTYTPTGSQQEKQRPDDPYHPAYEAIQDTSEASLGEADEIQARHTISLFA